MWFIMIMCHFFLSICRGELFDTNLSPLASLRFIAYEGKCDRDGTILPLYYFKIPRNTFDLHLLVNDVNSRGAQVIWDAWVMTVQGVVHDFCLINETDDKFVFEMEIDDWMGYRNVVGLVNTVDHHVCPVTPPRDCGIVHSIIFPVEVMWTPKWNDSCPPCIALTQEDIARAGSVHFL